MASSVYMHDSRGEIQPCLSMRKKIHTLQFGHSVCDIKNQYKTHTLIHILTVRTMSKSDAKNAMNTMFSTI